MLNRTTAVMRTAIHYAFPKTAFRLIHARHRHDEIELELLPYLVPPNLAAIDVGANIGRYAKPLSRLARHVHAFEPHPRLARILRASLPENVTVRQAAVSDGAGKVILHVPIVAGREDEGLAHVDLRNDRADAMAIQVDAVALDELALTDIGFVKIDVEGHELRVLAGARRLIKDQRPVVVVEAEDRHSHGATAGIADFFAARDYAGFFVLERSLHDIEDFSTTLQDPMILLRTPRGRRRDTIPYVNNFLFLPREQATRGMTEKLQAVLAAGGRESGQA